MFAFLKSSLSICSAKSQLISVLSDADFYVSN